VKVASGVLQLLGLGLTLLGLAVVRSWLKRTADTANDVKQGLALRWGRRREHLRGWWDRRRGRAVIHAVSVHDTGKVSDVLTGTATRPWPDRTTISDRDWLAQLDDRVRGLYENRDQDNERRNAGSEELDRRLQAQRDEFRSQLEAATRDGWELIVLGVALSAAGTLLGIWS
jgi:hypothetical protein